MRDSGPPLFWPVTWGSVALLAFFLAWRLLSLDSLTGWVVEDGFFENATAILYGAAAVLFLMIARRPLPLAASSQRFAQIFLVIGAVGVFVIMGEEISWGQRIFGFSTPPELAAANLQDEFNFHNLEFIQTHLGHSQTSVVKANAFSLLLALVGVALPLAAATPWGRSLIQRFGVPVVPACYVVLFAGALLFGKYARADWEHRTPKEIREFLWGLGVFLFALHGLRRPWDLFRLPEPADSTERLATVSAARGEASRRAS